jgi:hypothetical protein
LEYRQQPEWDLHQFRAKKSSTSWAKSLKAAAQAAEGSLGITGTSTFNTPCFSAGTIQPGTFPSGSFILGMSVGLEAQTSNGVLTFLGTLNQDGSGEMSGSYTVSGGGCDDSGTAVLHVAGAWDY